MWPELKLKDIGCSFLSGFAFKSSDYKTNGIPLIKIGNIQGRNVNIDPKGDFISVDTVNDKVSKYYLSSGDVLIAMTGQGSVGRVGRIRLNEEKALLNQRVGKFICDEKRINIDYLYYVLASPKYQEALFNAGSGSGQPNLSPELILDFEIPAPDYDTQKEISEILCSLDNKIDLLHRQNKTLEQLAETLFRQWFVEEAEDSWGLVRVGDVADINKHIITKDYPHQEIEYLDTGSITEGQISTLQLYRLTEAPSRAQRIVRNNDIVYSLVRPVQRHYGILHGVKSNMIVSTGFSVITAKNVSPHFLYLLLTRDETVEYFDMIAEGSTSAYPSLRPSDITNFEFTKPSDHLLNKFEEYASNAWTKIHANNVQILQLTELRNLLLPKLINGEIVIKQ